MTKKLNNLKSKEIFSDILNLFISGCFFALAYNMFLVPGGIFIGGAGGIATVLRILYGLPTGLMIFCINVPLLLLFMYFYGFRSSVKALIGIAVSSTFVDVTAMLNFIPQAFPNPEENSILYAIFGGGVLGIAVAFMFKRGYTTGGSDLAALLLKLKFKGLPTPKVILAVDACVVLFAAIATQDARSILYSFLAIFMCSSALEFVNGGFEKTRLAYIFSEKYQDVADSLMKNLNRGVTLLDGMGWYTKEDKKIILCVVKKNELFELKTAVRNIDASAFMILGEATETIGEGFKEVLGDIAIEPKKRGKKKNADQTK